jgi:Ca2+-binding RTX toxin-like protein
VTATTASWAATGDDSLIGGLEYDSIVGGDGNDTIDGGDENDTIYGGDGADSIEAGEEFADGDSDLIYGGRRGRIR